MTGYIKIYRNILEWEWWSDINTYRLFTYMVLKANWKDGRFKGLDIPKGSFVSSVSKLSDETSLTVNEVRTALKHLIHTNEITSKSHGKFTVFTVNNYCLYQEDNEQLTSTNNSQEDNEQITSNQQPINNLLTSSPRPINDLLTTIEERKKYKEGNKEKKEKGKTEIKEGAKAPKKSEPKIYYPNDEKLNRAFSDYAEMRKKIKKPLTDRAVELAMKKLQELSTSVPSGNMDNDTAIKILEQSTMNCWQGLFPLKGEKQESNNFSEWEKKWRDA